MDPNGHIYRDLDEEIPPEDKARLDGYLTTKAEEGEIARMRAEVEALQAKLEAARGERGEA